MAEENVESVRAFYDAINSHEVDRIVSLCTPDVVVDMSEAIGPDNEVYRGPDAATVWWRDSLEQWDRFSYEMENVTAIPPDGVVTRTRVHARGRTSGVELTARVGQHWRVVDGRVAYVKLFQTEEEALAAAGAAPPR